jgi:hypothetical protein
LISYMCVRTGMAVPAVLRLVHLLAPYPSEPWYPPPYTGGLGVSPAYCRFSRPNIRFEVAVPSNQNFISLTNASIRGTDPKIHIGACSWPTISCEK